MKSHRITLAAFALALVAGLALAPALQAQRYDDRSHMFRVRAGLYELEGDSDYWDDAAFEFTGDVDDFEDVVAGLDYRLGLGNGRLGLLISASGYGGESDRAYRDFTDNFGDEIVHTATLDIAAFTAGLTIHLAPRHAAVQPYVGAGGGVYLYDLEERGEFIDFDTFEIFDEVFITDGNATGYFFLAGIDIPVSQNLALFAEGRWHRAEDELSDDFDGLGDIDLGGREISAGLAFTF